MSYWHSNHSRDYLGGYGNSQKSSLLIKADRLQPYGDSVLKALLALPHVQLHMKGRAVWI